MKALLFLSIIFISANLFSQSSEQLIEETISKYESHTNVSYDIEYMMKFFDANEPVYITVLFLLRKIASTLCLDRSLFTTEPIV